MPPAFIFLFCDAPPLVIIVRLRNAKSHPQNALNVWSENGLFISVLLAHEKRAVFLPSVCMYVVLNDTLTYHFALFS